MLKTRHRLTRIIFVLLTLLLAGCQNPFIKSDTSTPSTTEDLLLLRDQAEQAYARQDYQAALPLYQQLNEVVPNDALLWLKTGNVLARLDRPTEAIQNYQQALRQDPRLATAWHNMGVLQLRMAANTFVQMVQNLTPEDKLYPRAVMLSEAILQILGARPVQADQAPEQDNAQ